MNPPAAPLTSIGRRQTAALADLIDLSNTSDRTERELVEHIAARNAWLKRRTEQNVERIESRAQSKQRRHKKTYETQRAALEQKYAEKLAKLEGDAAKLRSKISAQSQDSESKTQNEYRHEKWVADSMLEGVLGKLRKEYEKDQAQLTEMQEQSQAFDAQVLACLKSYRHPQLELEPLEPWADPQDLDHADSDNPEQAFSGLFDQYPAERDKLASDIRRLKKLMLPSVFVSFVPYLLWLVFTAGIAAGVVLLCNQLEVTWSPMFSAIGGFVIGGGLVWGIGKLVFGVASRKITTCFDAYRDTRRAHHDYLGQLNTASLAKREVRAADATAVRDESHAATETKYAPYFEKISARTEHSSAELKEKVSDRLQKLNAQRDAELSAFDDQARQTHQAIADRLARRLDITERRRARDQAAIDQHQQTEASALQQRWDSGRDRVLQSLEEMRRLEETSNLPWDADAWADWQPPHTPAPAVRFGSMQIQTDALLDEQTTGGRFDLGLPASLHVPALLSGPDDRSLYIGATPEHRDHAMQLLSSVILRLLTTLPPSQAKFTLIDPVGLGESFGGLMHLADHEESLVNGRVWSEPAHIDRRLIDLTDHMGQMIQKYLRNDYDSIDEYNAQAGELAEPYRFLVAADYPHGFSSEAVSRLTSIAASGARCGVFVLVLHDTRNAPAGDGDIEDLKRHCTVVTHNPEDQWRWRHPTCERFPLTPDTPPGEALTTQLINKIGRAAIEAGRVQVPFSTITPTTGSDEFWSRSASEDLEVTVGRSGATRLQSFRLGRGVAQHALVAGKTGSGKSSLLHTLITNLCLWYPPDQLELYLIDFKKGVEFKPYVNNRPPHLRAIAIESDREFGLSILKRLDSMLDERGEKFRASGVANLAGYHGVAPDDPMPRVLLVVDEFQELFGQDDQIAQNATLLLDRLVRQGRAFGMHVFLGSQSLSGAAGLPRGTMGQMAVRIALQCSENDSQLILGDENSAARLLTRPGEAIYNDQGGSLEANSLFQVAWLPDHELRENLETISRLTAERGVKDAPCFVFEGNAPASFADNVPLLQVLDAPAWPTDDKAPLAYIGEPIAIDDPTGISFPKLNGANTLVLGQNADTTLGLVCSSLLSLAAAHHPERARFVVFNGSTEPQHDQVIRDTLEVMPHGFAQVPFRDVDASLAELHAELKRRIDTGDVNAPTTFITIFGLQRFRQFKKSEDSFSFSMDDTGDAPAKPDEQLQDILRDGPVVGIHLIVAADRAASLEQVFDRRALREFDSRVLFQMSATDSAQIIDSSDANDLGPYRALIHREDRGTIARFRPYGTPSEDDLVRFKRALSRPYRGFGAPTEDTPKT